MSRQRRSMPSVKAIHQHWIGERFETAATLFNQHDFANPTCYCCGYIGDLERAHIIDRVLNGIDRPQNLILLCRICHTLMPSMRDFDQLAQWIRPARNVVTALGNDLPRPSRSEQTRTAMAKLKANGVRLGRPVALPNAIRQRIATMRGNGLSLRLIADTLTDEGVPTARGGKWHASTVATVLRSLDLDEEAAA